MQLVNVFRVIFWTCDFFGIDYRDIPNSFGFGLIFLACNNWSLFQMVCFNMLVISGDFVTATYANAQYIKKSSCIVKHILSYTYIFWILMIIIINCWFRDGLIISAMFVAMINGNVFQFPVVIEINASKYMCVIKK